MENIPGNTAPNFRQADCCQTCEHLGDIDYTGEGCCDKHTRLLYDYEEGHDSPKRLEIMGTDICDDFKKKV